MADERTSDWWNTIDFLPAPPGWRVVYLYPKLRQTFPVAGWLIQERYTQRSDAMYTISPDLGEDEQLMGRRRRIVPGIIAGPGSWMVEAVDENLGHVTELWQVVPPGAPDPTDEEEREERARRTRSHNGGSDS